MTYLSELSLSASSMAIAAVSWDRTFTVSEKQHKLPKENFKDGNKVKMTLKECKWSDLIEIEAYG